MAWVVVDLIVFLLDLFTPATMPITAAMRRPGGERRRGLRRACSSWIGKCGFQNLTFRRICLLMWVMGLVWLEREGVPRGGGEGRCLDMWGLLSMT